MTERTRQDRVNDQISKLLEDKKRLDVFRGLGQLYGNQILNFTLAVELGVIGARDYIDRNPEGEPPIFVVGSEEGRQKFNAYICEHTHFSDLTGMFTVITIDQIQDLQKVEINAPVFFHPSAIQTLFAAGMLIRSDLQTLRRLIDDRDAELMEILMSDTDAPTPVMKDGTLENFTIKDGTGKGFRCHCGSNVFHKPDSNRLDLYECNGCTENYTGVSVDIMST